MVIFNIFILSATIWILNLLSNLKLFITCDSYTGFSEKLSSCLDQLHSILGENLDECTAVTAVIQNNFDLERALDQILSGGMFYCVCHRSNYVQVHNCTGWNNFFYNHVHGKVD